MIYTVTFNPSLDYIVSVDDFKLGLTNRTSSELMLPGGKGINVSTVLMNLEIGNTEKAAGIIRKITGAELFQIEQVKPYAKNYNECIAQAQEDQKRDARPELKQYPDSLEDYDVIYLGYPIWYGDMPMAVYTFLESYNFAGKTIIPFCTHAGSGLAGTVSSIQDACSGAAVLDGLAIAGTTAQNDPEDARDAVHTWLSLS